MGLTNLPWKKSTVRKPEMWPWNSQYYDGEKSIKEVKARMDSRAIEKKKKKKKKVI
jgi:hypothetical protein